MGLILKLAEFLQKLLGPIIAFIWPSALQGAEIRVRRLSVKRMSEVEDLIRLYCHTFPEDGTNYSEAELLELLEDIKNEKKHVKAAISY